MEPISTVTGAWSIAKAAGEAAKKLHELSKNLKDRDIKAQVHEVVDQLHELKQSASELEDENRELRGKLRFKSDEYEFRAPFWYDKAHPDRALCPKCFAKNIAAPMGRPGQGCSSDFRRCLVCDHTVEVSNTSRPSPVMRTDFPIGRR